MKKRYCILILFAVFLLIMSPLSVNPEKNIVENIVVEEWMVPIYAVDARGNSVTDLDQNEIELYVNDKKINKFNFIKRKFLNENIEKPRWFKSSKEEKIIILVFDTALTRSQSIMKSKAVADQLVEKSGDDTKFILFKINGFHGLSYLGGPTRDKQRIRKIIKKRVVPIANERSASSGIDDSEGEKAKYEEEERVFFHLEQMKWLSNKSRHFSSSFRDLYYATKNILGTKFIYLFSEGISPASYRRGDTHAGKMAGNLLRSGAVLFFINPAGGRGSDPESGEEFLRILSTLSGGKYLTGDTKSITDKIEKVHNGYYELTFQNPEDIKEQMLRIDVRSKRKNINIHTIRNLEKSKEYLALDNFEKNMAVLNMISKNTIFKLPVEIEEAKLLKLERKKLKTIYHISIPEHFRNTDLDLYKIHMPKTTGNKPILKKSRIKISSNVLKTEISNKDGFTSHFALINYNMGLAIIKGIEKNSINIRSSSFSNGVLEFELNKFRLKKVNEKEVGLLRITIKIIDTSGQEIKSDMKEISVIKQNTKLKIPIKRVNPGNYNILIIAKDMITGDETSRTIEAKIK